MQSDERFVIFLVNGARLAIAAGHVAEVLPVPRLTRPPQAPGFLAGFANLGGEAAPVIALSRVIGEARQDDDDLYRHLLRLTGVGAAGRPTLLLVDRVEEVAATAEGVSEIEAARSVNGVLSANLLIGGDLVPRLDPTRLLLADEQQRMAELAQAEQTRLADLRVAGA
jgi:purine-binding chemotaxis protein CheW